MCGIVGYIGNKENAQSVLLGGLRTLEYRGYDSSGMALINKNGKVTYTRAVGKVAELEKKLKKNSTTPMLLGIAHTRWATHGKPSLKNAHPHKAENIYLVHNGIIENYRELKEQLLKSGAQFTSDTDSEILAHLINREHVKGTSLHSAVRRALAHVVGAYAIAVVSSDEPGVLVVARMSSPLVIGVGNGEHIIASDAAAIIKHTKRVVYLADGEVAELRADGYRVTNLQDEHSHKEECELEWDEQQAKLAGYPHFMLKEIEEESFALTEAIRGRINAKNGSVKLGGLEIVTEELKDIERIIIVSCGTSYHAGLIGEYLIEEIAGVPCEVQYASEFRYRKSPLPARTAVLAISQSGETADTLAAIKYAKSSGVLTLGIVNVVGSSISRDTDAGIYNHAGPEISVASTKAFVSQLSILVLLAVFLGKQRQLSKTGAQKILNALDDIPDKMSTFIKDNSAKLKKMAKKYAKYNTMMYLGRKYQYPVALEGALKIKEIAYIYAEGYPAGEMKHGPIALIDKDMLSVIFAPKDSVYEKTLGAIEEIKARGGPVIAITTKDGTEAMSLADDSIIIPSSLEELLPLLSVLPAQLFAYYFAVIHGKDVDKPRNLAKSVTVE